MISITVYGLGYTLKEQLEADGQTVRRLLELLAEKSGRAPEEFFGENVTYLSGGKRVYPEDVLRDGDTLTVMAILCGG